MAFISRFKFLLVIIVAVGLMAVTAAMAAAHESRDAGDFSYIVGWETEPAYEGFPNAVSVRITGPLETSAGALFDGGTLEHDETYSFTFGLELADSTVPYHNHLSPELGGTVMVTEDAPEGDVEIEITAAGFTPANVMVRPGSAVVWTNVDDSVQAVHSGEGQMVMDGAMDMSGDAMTMDGDAMTMDGDAVATDDHDHEAAAAPTGPIEGLDGALQVEVTHVPTGSTQTMTLTAAFRDPGHYVGRMIPTAPGGYKFRLTGEIQGAEIDETFDSGPGTFDDIQTQTSIQFPVEVSAPREIEGAVRGAADAVAIAEQAANAAADDASSARTLAIIAIVIGLGGVAIGAGGVVIGRRSR
ncbi:MAG: hypothetical protein QF554_13580 [Dehalococcoidia bacterium]|nr:hypothetical protein [Dehalococcoidia bacterium]